MRAEVESAVGFLTKLIGTRCSDPVQVNQFRQCLEEILVSHYDKHWFPERPNKGSGYRCIRIVESHMDPLVNRAGSQCGLSTEKLTKYLPNEITMWVDPEEVSYRIGEEGSIGMLYSSKNSDSSSEGYSEDSCSSSDSEVCSVGSPSPSPTQEIYTRNERVSYGTAYYNSMRNGNLGMFVPQMQFVAS